MKLRNMVLVKNRFRGPWVFLLLAVMGWAGEDGLLPVDGRWHYNRFLTYRPGPGLPVAVNPPRFSWPYVPGVVLTNDAPLGEFLLEIDAKGDFAAPDVRVVTAVNFFNGLGPLKPGTWHWRVTYGPGKPGAVTSTPRSFQVAPGTPEWDRRIILDLNRVLATRPRPRTLGAGGWEALRRAVTVEDPTKAEAIRTAAGKAMGQPWYQAFPETDQFSKEELAGMNRARRLAYADMADGLYAVMLAHQVTGDAQYAGALERVLKLAAFSKGGLSSPEYHGSTVKFTTRITGVLGLAYDWYHGDLKPEERAILSGSLDWRLRAWFRERGGWARGDRIDPDGLAVAAESHPYQGSLWNLPALFAVADKNPVAAEALSMMTHYLCGVTGAAGPDEAWNEGEWYGFEKPQTMLEEMGWYRLILPELAMEKNPVLRALPDWQAQILRLGQKRFPFGDTHSVGVQWHMARVAAREAFHLTGATRFAEREAAWVSWLSGMTNHEDVQLREQAKYALFLGRQTSLSIPALLSRRGPRNPGADPLRDEPEATAVVYPEAGWVFAGNVGPSHPDQPTLGFSVAFASRSRGAYSHSYRAENGFQWQAFGEMLLAGGSGNRITDDSARWTMMHQGILVDGQGQEYDEDRPAAPWYGRILYFRTNAYGASWGGDATRAYPNVPGLARVHRHVVFLKPGAVVVFDDLAFAGRKGTFSMVCHTGPDPEEPSMSRDRGLDFRWTQRRVAARLQVNPFTPVTRAAVRTGEHLWRNEFTGEDLYPKVKAGVLQKEKQSRMGSGYGVKILEDLFPTRSLWVDAPEGESAGILWVLTAAPSGGEPMAVDFKGPRTVVIGKEKATVVSFGERPEAAVFVDLERVRRHGAEGLR